MVKKLFLLIVSVVGCQAIGQVGIGTNSPDAASLLELNATDKGLLLPRVELYATDQPNPMTQHVAGMVVYNIRTSEAGPFAITPGMYYNDGSSWIRMTTKLPTNGDIKYGFQSADHEGWFLLNGRAVTTLNAVARHNATLLGYAVSLPNAADRFLKTQSGVEAIGAVGGAATFSLVRANLPILNLTGNTGSSGAHTHTYTDNAATARNYISGSNNPLANNANTSFTTGSASANHTHTMSFSSGGSGTAVNFVPSYLVANVFMYLGN